MNGFRRVSAPQSNYIPFGRTALQFSLARQSQTEQYL